MYCRSSTFRCRDQGFCDCSYDDNTAQAAGGCGELAIFAFIGVFAAFLYPAIRILRKNIEYDQVKGSPHFSGAVWLFTSPLFGFLANMLYQVVFAVGACSIGTLESKISNTVFAAGFFLIYALAMGLAVIAFLVKNRIAIKLFIVESTTRTVSKTATLIGLFIIIVITGCAVIGTVYKAIDGYFYIQVGNEGRFKNEKAKFESYFGKYKFTSRNQKELVIVSKSNNGDNLIVYKDEGKNSNKDSGCLLKPQLNADQIYYLAINCSIDGKKAPLRKVYFKNENSTKMIFIYNVFETDDILKKVS